MDLLIQEVADTMGERRGAGQDLMIRIPKKIVFVAITIVVVFYGYKAIQFNKKVSVFNTRIQIGDNMTKVRALMGRPTHILAANPIRQELADRYGLKTRETILMVYRGGRYFRADLNLIFNPDTGELLEKDRASHWWYGLDRIMLQ